MKSKLSREDRALVRDLMTEIVSSDDGGEAVLFDVIARLREAVAECARLHAAHERQGAVDYCALQDRCDAKHVALAAAEQRVAALEAEVTRLRADQDADWKGREE